MILSEPKFHDLEYNVKVDFVKRRTQVGYTDFKKQMPRRALMPGVIAGMLDPTGHGFIDESMTGLEGQGYGLASYKKGLWTESTIDISRAN